MDLTSQQLGNGPAQSVVWAKDSLISAEQLKKISYDQTLGSSILGGYVGVGAGAAACF